MLPFFISDEIGFSDEELLLMCAASGGKTVEDTATGNPLTFVTDIARPLRSLLIPFTPIQSGTGDPSPENIRSILPWNGLTVFGGGKNLLNLVAQSKTEQGVTWNVDGDTILVSGSATGYTSLYCGSVNVEGLKNVIVSGLSNATNVVWECALLDENNNRIWISNSVRTNISVNVAEYPTAKRLSVNIKRNNNGQTSGTINIQVEIGTTATAYEPYHPITDTDIVFPSPVYGGTLDAVTGVLTVEWKSVVLNGEESWTINGTTDSYTMFTTLLNDSVVVTANTDKAVNCYCDKLNGTSANIATNRDSSRPRTAYDTAIITTNRLYIVLPNSIATSVRDIETWLAENNVSVVYKLAEPQTVTLTPAQITALVGDNTIWSDANGSMTAVYLKKG